MVLLSNGEPNWTESGTREWGIAVTNPTMLFWGEDCGSNLELWPGRAVEGLEWGQSRFRRKLLHTIEATAGG